MYEATVGEPASAIHLNFLHPQRRLEGFVGLHNEETLGNHRANVDALKASVGITRSSPFLCLPYCSYLYLSAYYFN